MNARELTFRGSDSPIIYACGQCGSLHSPKVYAGREDIAHQAARNAAEDCCTPRHCACGAEIHRYWTVCNPCRLRRKLTAATITAEYNGPVYADGVRGEWGEGYSSDIYNLRQSCDDYEDEVPAYCWPCTGKPLRLDVGDIIETACEEHHEDAADQIVGYDDLRAAIERFNAAQTCVTYYPDYSRIIILDRERFDALIAPPSAPDSMS